jgi:quaternary ammonium compound-resistance protein SugE
MGWFYLLIAGVLEIGFTTALRYSEGFTKLVPTAIVLILAVACFYLVARSTETIPLGTAYAVWGAFGSVGTVLVGIYAFQEPIEVPRLVLIGVIIAAVVGLKFVSE